MLSSYENRWKIFSLVAISIFMSTLDSSIVNVALPYMMQELQTDINTIQWVVLIYLMIVSSLLLTFGRLSDIKGKKPVYVLGFTIFVAGSFLCGMARTHQFLIISRALQGCGASMLMACSPALIVDVFPVHERGKALGMIGAVVAAGLTTGPVAGGILLEYFSWRFIFYINIPIGIIAALSGIFVLKTAQRTGENEEPMDKIGSLLLIIILSSLIAFLTQMSKWGIVSIHSISISGLFILACIGFVVNETRSDYPLFDMDLLKIKLFVFPVISSAVLFAALFVIVFMMPFFLTYPCGFSASKTGLIMIIPFLFLLIVSPVSGMLYNKFGSRLLCMTGISILTLSLISLMTLQPFMGILSIFWRIALAGIGTALYVPPNNTAIMSCVQPSKRGIASGAVATARNIGMVIGVALAGLIFTTSFSSLTNGLSLENYLPGMEPFFMISFKRTMLMGAVLSIFGIGVTFARGKEG
ncbi:MAG: MFS transporter [Desulfobacula sp.]|jgi:EmrB/QacA subfamily drug resistance transporter|uniref:MFS transporter n=1 Tax=Desulfobacula sp. TaxID=2593537 RepID=UPI001DF606C3|nr:MFS transporter [Desulfobacula sp.]MBT3485011.1 MFS transporter [Desulfobacula sp.]MBT3804172.1 MFS transporter [Desulfobacula sp.]MBT4025028.1 MFS transporter [Desulfobacula sp.]MBT4198662.1 MFS transporter [Desulfobacula sp.]